MPDTLTEAPQGEATVTLNIERFDSITDPDRRPGMRGTRVTAHTGFTGAHLFSSDFPVVHVGDDGHVEIGEHRVPADQAVDWLLKVANHIDAREDAR